MKKKTSHTLKLKLNLKKKQKEKTKYWSIQELIKNHLYQKTSGMKHALGSRVLKKKRFGGSAVGYVGL